jgi:predicted GNAT family N-acyltransferase
MPAFRVRCAEWSTEAARLQQIRLAVFVREQGVPLELECDEFDPISRHVIAEAENGQAIGTGRLLPDGHIGRMAVLREWRKRGVGGALLRALLAMARESGMERVVLHAQTHALGFYARHGFESEGEEFLEAGIPHRRMVRHLVTAQDPAA